MKRTHLPLHHPLAHAPYVTSEKLAKELFLVIEKSSLSKLLEALRKNGLEPYVRQRVHDNYSIMSMVESILGVSILPELVLQKTNYQIAILPIRPAITRKIGLVMKKKMPCRLQTNTLLISCFLMQRIYHKTDTQQKCPMRICGWDI